MLTTAVVGLGRAGSRFDEEPRPAIWSHVGAYLAERATYRLVGGADIDDANRTRFAARSPDAAVFADAAEMMARLAPDVVSVCTPPAGRAALVERMLAAHKPRVLIAEKPLEVDAAARRRLIEACGRAGVALMVNYNRRYLAAYRGAREAVASGRIGPVASITVLAGNRLWSMGSHAVNLLLYFAGGTPASWRALALPALNEEGEPAGDLVCRFAGGMAGRVITAGTREMLVFETDILGRSGRIRIREPEARATFARFVDSSRYSGYKVLARERPLNRTDEGESAFVALVREAAEVADGRSRPSSTGEDACAGEDLVGNMIESLSAERAA